MIDIEVHHFTGQRERPTSVADADVTRIATAPQALKQSEGRITFFVEHRELDGRIFECSHSCTPAVVRASTGIGFGLLEADRQIFDVGDLDAVDSEDGFETKFDFWHCE